ncbi:unnamed protein product, partial [Nesidiocoris tenuis]
MALTIASSNGYGVASVPIMYQLSCMRVWCEYPDSDTHKVNDPIRREAKVHGSTRGQHPLSLALVTNPK